jgi:phosphoenolpyruvate-protein kinase (PTS system EI component)
MLGDPSLRDEIRDEIERELTSAAHALVRVFDRWQERFRQMPNEELRERADDLLDLQGRLLREIAGVETTALEKMPQNRLRYPDLLDTQFNALLEFSRGTMSGFSCPW